MESASLVSQKESEFLSVLNGHASSDSAKVANTLCIYFLFKQSEGRNLNAKLAVFTPDDTKAILERIETDIIKQSIDDLEKEKIEFDLVSSMSERKGTIFFFDNKDSSVNENLQRLIELSNDTGDGSAYPEVNFQNEDDVLNVDGVVFVISNGSKQTLIYKKQYNVQNFSRKRFIFKNKVAKEINDRSLLERVGIDMLSLDVKASLIISNDDVFVYDFKVFESQFGYVDYINSVAKSFSTVLSGFSDIISNMSSFESRLSQVDENGSSSFRKKIAKVLLGNNIIGKVSNSDILSFVKENEYLRDQFKIELDSTSLNLDTHEQQHYFLSLIGDGILYSKLTQTSYISNSKKVLAKAE